jgi:hypothetical protein
LARESYLQYRDHPDERSAAEMRQGLARSVQYEGLLRFRIGEWNHSLQFLDWAEQKYRDGRNYRRTAKLLNIKARIYRDRNEEGDIRRAREALNEALRILGEVGDKYATAESYLTYMILEYQEYRENRSQGHRQAEEHLKKAQEWYEKGAKIAHENSYILLQAVYEGMLGNVLFDQLMEENRRDGEFRLEPAFDRYLEECWWGAHFEKRRFFRSLDLLIQRLSLLNASEIRHYIRYIRQKWEQLARGGRLPSQDGSKGDRENLVLAAEYVTDMQNFCDLVEEFSEDIAS